MAVCLYYMLYSHPHWKFWFFQQSETAYFEGHALNLVILEQHGEQKTFWKQCAIQRLDWTEFSLWASLLTGLATQSFLATELSPQVARLQGGSRSWFIGCHWSQKLQYVEICDRELFHKPVVSNQELPDLEVGVVVYDCVYGTATEGEEYTYQQNETSIFDCSFFCTNYSEDSRGNEAGYRN